MADIGTWIIFYALWMTVWVIVYIFERRQE